MTENSLSIPELEVRIAGLEAELRARLQKEPELRRAYVTQPAPRFRQLPDGSVWPRTGDPADPDEVGLEWRLRHAPESITRGDQLHLASIVSAYRELLRCTEKRRREVVRGMKATVNGDGGL